MKKIFGIFMFAIMGCFMTSCVAVVDSGEVGIKYKKFGLTDQGKVDAVPCTGWTFYNPFTTSVFAYDAYIQRVNYAPFNVRTKDGAVFSMDPVLAYQLQRERAVDVFTEYRVDLPDIEQGYMKTAVFDAYRITANTYTSDELMSNKAEFESKVRAMLDKSLLAKGFVVSEFTSDIVPPKSLEEAITAKNNAIQAALKAENLVKQAEADAKIAVAKAEGEAKAMKIKADAEAYYNRTIGASLSPMIVQEDLIEKWDGKLPTVSGGNNPLINILKQF